MSFQRYSYFIHIRQLLCPSFVHATCIYHTFYCLKSSWTFDCHSFAQASFLNVFIRSTMLISTPSSPSSSTLAELFHFHVPHPSGCNSMTSMAYIMWISFPSLGMYQLTSLVVLSSSCSPLWPAVNKILCLLGRKKLQQRSSSLHLTCNFQVYWVHNSQIAKRQSVHCTLSKNPSVQM